MTPFPLNDGEDNLMIDYSGSMTDIHWQQGIPCWWFKAGRHISGVSRKEMPLIRPGMLVENAEGLEFPGEFEQDFDPEEGILRTRITFSETTVAVESLLARGAFQRRVEVLHAPPGTRLAFTLNDRRLWKRQGPDYQLSEPLDYFAEEAVIGFRYRHEPSQEGVQFGRLPGFEGVGLQLAWDASGRNGTAKADYKCPRFLHGRAVAHLFDNVRQGDVFSCATVLFDDQSPIDEPPRTAADRRLREIREAGHEACARGHADGWARYHGRSRITIGGAPIANYTARMSLHILKSSQHPSGSIPCSATYPMLGSSAFWDTWGSGSAFARLNHPEEALRLGRFWIDTLPQARRQAEALGAPGARIPWTSMPAPNTGYCPRFPQPQYHNIGVAMEMAWEAYAYSGDDGFLQAFEPLIEACVEFQEHWLIEHDGGEPHLRAVGSLDENPEPRRDDSWTIATVLRSFEIRRAVRQRLGRADDGPSKTEQALRALLHNAVGERGLEPYPNARLSSLGALAPYRLLPDLPGFDATWDRYATDCREREGLGFGRYSHTRCRVFPWIQAKAAATRTRMRRTGVWGDWLEPLLDYVDQWAGFPEYWRYARENSMPYYTGAHGFYLTALAELLADRRGDRVDLLWDAPNLPPDLAFEGVSLPGRLLASGELAGGRVKNLEVQNAGDAPTGSLTLAHPGGEDANVVLQPGERWGV